MFSISTAAGLLALSSAEVFEFSDLEVATDRWFYPFNATPGDRILASTFGQDIYTVFDDRDGQFLLTFDLTELGIATPIDPNQITFEALRLEVNYEGTNPVVYDNTIDDPSTFGSAGAPDVDAGRPLELWAVGWRDGWTAGTFPEDGPYSADGSSFGRSVRNAYPQTTDASGVLQDASNQPSEGFAADPLAIGLSQGTVPGDLIPADSTIAFEMNTISEADNALLSAGCAEGTLALMLTSMTEVVEGGEGADYPSYYCREHPNVTFDLAFAARLSGTITIFNGPPPSCEGDIDSDGQVGLSDVLIILSEWGCSDCISDVDGNGTTGFDDVISVLAVWGPCTG